MKNIQALTVSFAPDCISPFFHLSIHHLHLDGKKDLRVWETNMKVEQKQMLQGMCPRSSSAEEILLPRISGQ